MSHNVMNILDNMCTVTIYKREVDIYIIKYFSPIYRKPEKRNNRKEYHKDKRHPTCGDRTGDRLATLWREDSEHPKTLNHSKAGNAQAGHSDDQEALD